MILNECLMTSYGGNPSVIIYILKITFMPFCSSFINTFEQNVFTNQFLINL